MDFADLSFFPFHPLLCLLKFKSTQRRVKLFVLPFKKVEKNKTLSEALKANVVECLFLQL